MSFWWLICRKSSRQLLSYNLWEQQIRVYRCIWSSVSSGLTGPKSCYVNSKCKTSRQLCSSTNNPSYCRAFSWLFSTYHLRLHHRTTNHLFCIHSHYSTALHFQWYLSPRFFSKKSLVFPNCCQWTVSRFICSARMLVHPTKFCY